MYSGHSGARRTGILTPKDESSCAGTLSNETPASLALRRSLCRGPTGREATASGTPQAPHPEPLLPAPTLPGAHACGAPGHPDLAESAIPPTAPWPRGQGGREGQGSGACAGATVSAKVGVAGERRVWRREDRPRRGQRARVPDSPGPARSELGGKPGAPGSGFGAFSAPRLGPWGAHPARRRQSGARTARLR